VWHTGDNEVCGTLEIMRHLSCLVCGTLNTMRQSTRIQRNTPTKRLDIQSSISLEATLSRVMGVVYEASRDTVSLYPTSESLSWCVIVSLYPSESLQGIWSTPPPCPLERHIHERNIGPYHTHVIGPYHTHVTLT